MISTGNIWTYFHSVTSVIAPLFAIVMANLVARQYAVFFISTAFVKARKGIYQWFY